MSDTLLIAGICTLALSGFMIAPFVGLAILACGMFFFALATSDRKKNDD